MDRHVGSRPTVSAWMSLMSIILKFYTGSLMINLGFHDILGSGIKQDHRSGKERQCCRYIRTVSIIYIARVIFRVRLCPQPIKLNGLFRHALTRPDQVDIWDQVLLCAYWNDQIKQFIMLRLPLVRKDRRFFCAEREKLQMERYIRDHSFTNLLPSGEIKGAEPITEDKIQKNKAA